MSLESGALAEFNLTLDLLIRHCRREDLDALEWWGMHREHREIIQAAFDRQQRGEVEMLVADLDGFPIGQVWIDYRRVSGTEHSASLWAVRVLPPLQNKGIGRRLLLVAEERIRHQGRRDAVLTVERTNHDARRFYERLGYLAVGKETGSYSYRTPDGEHRRIPLDQWVMRKTLSPISRLMETGRVAVR